MSEHSVASGALGAASFSPRPVAAVALAAVAAAGATSIGTDLGGSLDSGGAGFAAAVAIAALALASVFVGAARGTHPSVVPVALLSAGAATIHLAAASSHFREWWAFGVFFVGSGVAQLVWALLTVRSPTPIVWWSGVLGNAAIIALWVLTRTVGTLVGPDAHTPEPIGVADAAASGLELAIVLAAVTCATARRSNRRLAWSVAGLTLALTTLALFSVLGIANGVIPSME
jgi:hypothetical protein